MVSIEKALQVLIDEIKYKCMKLLKTYVLKEHIAPFLLGLAIFSSILFMGRIRELIDWVVNKEVGMGSIMKLMILLLPYLLSYSLPMALLCSTLMAFGRLSQDNEIAALRSSGMNLHSIISPILLVGLLSSLLSICLNDTILPRARYATRSLVKEMGIKNPSLLLKERVYIEEFEKYILHIEKVKGNHLYGIRIWERKEGVSPTIINAKEGIFSSDPKTGTIRLQLFNGTIDERDEEDPQKYRNLRFETKPLTLFVPSDGETSKRSKDMTINELMEKISRSREMELIRLYSMEIHRKISLSFASLAFVLIGIPLGIRAKQGSRSLGFGISLLLIIIYYIIFSIGEAISESIPPSLALWFPNLLLGGIGTYLILRGTNR